jgi:hypothetical protein
MDAARAIISPEYRRAVRVALCVQIPAALVCLLLLDGGRTAQICGIAMLGFWLVAAAVAAHRPWTPSAADLWFWRWGFIPCFVLALLLAAAA